MVMIIRSIIWWWNKLLSICMENCKCSRCFNNNTQSWKYKMVGFIVITHRDRKYGIISKYVKSLGQAFLMYLIYEINAAIDTKISYSVGWLFVYFTRFYQITRLQSSGIYSVSRSKWLRATARLTNCYLKCNILWSCGSSLIRLCQHFGKNFLHLQGRSRFQYCPPISSLLFQNAAMKIFPYQNCVCIS
jgi:hypothetical protein